MSDARSWQSSQHRGGRDQQYPDEHFGAPQGHHGQQHRNHFPLEPGQAPRHSNTDYYQDQNTYYHQQQQSPYPHPSTSAGSDSRQYYHPNQSRVPSLTLPAMHSTFPPQEHQIRYGTQTSRSDAHHHHETPMRSPSFTMQMQSATVYPQLHHNNAPYTPTSGNGRSATQTPSSSALRSDDGRGGRAFNLMAGLETPTHQDYARRSSDAYSEVHGISPAIMNMTDARFMHQATQNTDQWQEESPMHDPSQRLGHSHPSTNAAGPSRHYDDRHASGQQQQTYRQGHETSTTRHALSGSGSDLFASPHMNAVPIVPSPQKLSTNSLDSAWSGNRNGAIPSSSFYGTRVPQANAARSSELSRNHTSDKPIPGRSASSGHPLPSLGQPRPFGVVAKQEPVGGRTNLAEAPHLPPRTPPQPFRTITALQESPDPLSFFSPVGPTSASYAPHSSHYRPSPALSGMPGRLQTAHNDLSASAKRKDKHSREIVLKKPKKALKQEDELATLRMPSNDDVFSSSNTDLRDDVKAEERQEVGASPLYDDTFEQDDFGTPTKKQKRQKRKFDGVTSSNSTRINGLVEDSDLELDAADSDWDDFDMIETWNSSVADGSDVISSTAREAGKLSTGPVKISLRKVPLARLQGFMEDIFEADDALPDKDSLQDLVVGQRLSHDAGLFFEVVEEPSASVPGRRILLLRVGVLQKLLRLIVKLSLPLAEVSGTSYRSVNSAHISLSSIPVADLTRLLSILERTARAGEHIDPFPSQTVRQSMVEASTSSKKKKKTRTNGQISRSPSKSPATDHEASDGEEEQPADNSQPPQTGQESIVESPETLEKLNTTLLLVDRSVLAIECCLSIVSGDILPKQVMSEGLIRTCFESVKTCSDKVVLPFIEACSGASAVASHPTLTQLIDVLAPQKVRKKKTAQPVEDPSSMQGIGTACRNTLSDLFHHLCSALFLVQRMVRMASVSLSDSIIISAVYLALGPFFVMEPEPAGGNASSDAAKIAARGRSALLSLGGANAMKTLRLPAFHLLRNIFAKAPDQRQWMIEEILTSLTKLTDMKKHRRQYSLRNGKAIHSINALLLQLIQGASHGVSTYVRSTSDRLSREKERGDDPDTSADLKAAHTSAVSDAFVAADTGREATDMELAIWRRGLEGANQSARSIATYLMQKVGQTKVAKSSLEMSHTFIIENSVQDLLSALYLPEWPAAALMLSAFCRTFGSILEDPKSHPDAKGVALEQLGLIATRLRQSQLSLQTEGGDTMTMSSEDQKMPRSWDHLSMLRALRDKDQSAVQDFVDNCTHVSKFLARSASDDQLSEGAFEFLVVQAQGELALAHATAENAIEDCRSDLDSTSEQLSAAIAFKVCLESAIATLSKATIDNNDTKWGEDESDEKALVEATALSERLQLPAASMVTYTWLRDLLVEGLNSQLIANRSKALRGIDKVSQVDPDLLDNESIRAAIEVRLRDSSNAVRDGAVGLFGSYILRKPQYLATYYRQVSARIYDTGLSVRKRMVRLLRSIHETSDDWSIRIDSCAKIVRCVNDEDIVIQDLAVQTIGEMWLGFESTGESRRQRRVRSPANETASAELNIEAEAELTALEEEQAEQKMTDTIDVIMAVAELLKERPSPFEEVFRRIFKGKSDSEAAELRVKVQRLGDSMIDGLVEASEVSSVDTVKRIRIVQLLVSTNPAILTISKAKSLLPYLKAAQTSEEVQIMDLLLRIFRSCLPHMPKTALAFAEALEKSLRPLVNRPPPKAGLHLLQELIACYCAVITIHTHNFRLLIQTLKACFVRVQSMRQMALKGQKVEDVKAWSTLMSLTASLCEHADFDQIRKKHPDTVAEIDALCKRSLVDVISEALLDIYKHSSEAVRSIALQNLGFVFRAYPTLMTRSSMTDMMDAIFTQGSTQDRATLLKIILDFLSADSVRRNPDHTVTNVGSARRKQEDPNGGSVDMTILVGDTESFADTGVGSAMMQRYTEDVLKASLEVSNPSLQRTAVDILRYTVLNGLSHPIQCVPYLVSLETLEDRKIRSRALELHSHLASKHASLIQARFLDSARAAFRFQMKQSTPELLRGFRVDTGPVAMLEAWYSLLRDRRATRLDFLKQIVKAMDVNTADSECSMQEVLFARFIADNLATLDFKTMEEILTVVSELRALLAVSGMQVLYMIQSHLPLDTPLEPTVHEGARTPPPRSEVGTMGSLVSPMGIARIPWMSMQSPSLASTDDTDMSVHAANNAEFDKTSVDAITVARMSVIAGTALLLRNHLKDLYGLSEARCTKFNPGKKQSAGGDKPATMRGLADPMQAALDLSAMPLALRPITNDEEAKQQMTAYATMVETEGTMMEPDDADMLDDFF